MQAYSKNIKNHFDYEPSEMSPRAISGPPVETTVLTKKWRGRSTMKKVIDIFQTNAYFEYHILNGITRFNNDRIIFVWMTFLHY